MSSNTSGGSSPWSILGVSENASARDVRDAYRKLALRWHPDQNNGCSIALQKFQRIKEAFEDIQKLQESGRSPSNFYRNTNPTSNASSGRYNASYRYQRTTSSNFYDFRRDTDYSKSSSWKSQTYRQANQRYSSPFEYARANQNSNNRQAQSDWWRQWNPYSPRSRYMPVVGVGVAGFLMMSVIGIIALGTDVLWRANNRGKSFEDLMKTLDQRHEEQAKQRQKQKQKKLNSPP